MSASFRSEPPTARHDADLLVAREARLGTPTAVTALAERLELVPAIVEALDGRLGPQLDRESLDDVAQRAIRALWRRLDEYEGRTSLDVWVYGFCYRELDRARRDLNWDPEAPNASTADPDAHDASALHEALARLGPEESDALLLRSCEGLPFDELGELFGTDEDGGRRRYVAALRRIHEHESGGPELDLDPNFTRTSHGSRGFRR